MKSHGIRAEEAIRIEAYLLSERAGHPPGRDAQFWAQAEEIVHGRVAALTGMATVPKRVAAKKAPAAKKTAAKARTMKPDAKPATPVTAKKTAPAKELVEKTAASKAPSAKPVSRKTKPASGSKAR